MYVRNRMLLDKRKITCHREIARINLVIQVFFFYHNKIHPITSYKAFKNKSNKTRQHRVQNYIRHIQLNVNFVHRLNIKYI